VSQTSVRLTAAVRVTGAKLIRIAARDLTAEDPLALLDDIAGELADLADAALQAAVAIARTQVTGHERGTVRRSSRSARPVRRKLN